MIDVTLDCQDFDDPTSHAATWFQMFADAFGLERPVLIAINNEKQCTAQFMCDDDRSYKIVRLFNCGIYSAFVGNREVDAFTLISAGPSPTATRRHLRVVQQ